MKRRTRSRNQRGSTLVELPFALIWVFMVMFGLAETARLMLAYTTLSHAARAGTRYAIVHGSYRAGDCTDASLHGKAGPSDDPPCVLRVVKNAAAGGGLTLGSSDIKVRYVNGTNNIGDPVSVTVSRKFASVLPLLTPFSVTIGSKSEGTICY